MNPTTSHEASASLPNCDSKLMKVMLMPLRVDSIVIPVRLTWLSISLNAGKPITHKALILTNRAPHNLNDVYDYLADVSDDETAQSFIAKLAEHLELIALTGRSGVPRNSLCPRLRLSIRGR